MWLFLSMILVSTTHIVLNSFVIAVSVVEICKMLSCLWLFLSVALSEYNTCCSNWFDVTFGGSDNTRERG